MGLALESTFTSIPDMASELYPWLPVRTLTHYQYDTRSRMANIAIPILVIHSQEDEIIPFSHGKTLFQLARQPKQFIQLQGDHNYGFLESRDTYSKGWDKFIGDCLRQQVEFPANAMRPFVTPQGDPGLFRITYRR